MAILDKGIGLVEKDISAEDTFSDGIYVEGDFSFSISGTFVGTVTVQRSFDAGSTFRDVDSFTAPIETAGYDGELIVVYRAGIKTGDYTSGTASIRIGR